MTAPQQRPDVEPRHGPAAANLLVDDLTVGDGAEAVSGRTVAVHHVG